MDLRIVDFPEKLLKDIRVEAAVQDRTIKAIVIEALQARTKTVQVKIQAFKPKDGAQ